MKIAFVVINANRREGTSRAIVEVAERLAIKHQVTLIARTAESVNLERMRWRKIAAPAWPDVAEFELSRMQMDKLLARSNFDIVHSAGCNTRFADVYAIQTVHPVKMQINNLIDRNRRASPLRRLSRWLYDRQVVLAERRSYVKLNERGPVGYLPVSRGTYNELLATFDLAGSIAEVLPNGADLDTFDREKKTTERANIRSEFRCSDNSVVFLFVGGEWKRKGLQLALEALARLDASNTVLLVAGNDPDFLSYKQLAITLGIADRVRWLGFRSDIDCLYAASDVFLFPSFYEAFSLATIEAAASRLPVIMCNISGSEELLGDGTAGFIVDRSMTSVANAMVQLASSPILRSKMGACGRAKVEQIFNWQAIAERTETFYQKLLAIRAHARSTFRNTGAKRNGL